MKSLGFFLLIHESAKLRTEIKICVYPSALETTPTSATICLIYYKTSIRDREIDSQPMQKKDTSLNRRPSNLRPSGFTYSIAVNSKWEQWWESNETQRLNQVRYFQNREPTKSERRGEREEETRLTLKFAAEIRRRFMDGGDSRHSRRTSENQSVGL